MYQPLRPTLQDSTFMPHIAQCCSCSRQETTTAVAAARSHQSISGKQFLPHPTSPGRYLATSMPVPNFSRVLPSTSSRPELSLDIPARNSPCKAAGVKRWNGQTRTYSDWDGLRRDTELWHADGECLVHLYGKGKSRRGPAFKIPSRVVHQTQCGRLFHSGHARKFSDSSVCSRASDMQSVSDSGYSSSASSEDPCQIFVPAPEDSVKTDAFKWHITTRNLFAWMTNKPLVGSSLGQAFIDLLDRMLLVRPATTHNVQDFLDYAQNMGYMNFAHSPDYALAFLRFAEHFQLRDIWIDAFCHCVGMNDSLCLSSEFEHISIVTQARITRASLEMDLHLGRVTRALTNMLEEELSPASVGLSIPERAHLDRFRSFLHSYYVSKYGYWPPPHGAAFSKDILQSMHDEFYNLYDYLVDTSSSNTLAEQSSPATGGFCVFQNVDAFNRRHNYEALSHPLPLLPSCEHLDKRVQSQRGLRQLRLPGKSAQNVILLNARAAHLSASNKAGPLVDGCSLVQAYVSFEMECISRPEEKLPMADARKVRWLAIYCTLQMLVSVCKAPAQVSDSWTPTYHMCCLVTDLGAFDTPKETSLSLHPALRSCEVIETPPAIPSPVTDSAIDIRPDCESIDYFSHSRERRTSTSSLNPAPLRVNTVDPTIVRTASFRALSRRMSNFNRRRSVVVLTPTAQMISPVELDESQLATSTTDYSELDDYLNRKSSLYQDLCRTPTLDLSVLDCPSFAIPSPSLFLGVSFRDIPRTPSPYMLDTDITPRSHSIASSDYATSVSGGSEGDSSNSATTCDEPTTPITPMTPAAVFEDKRSGWYEDSVCDSDDDEDDDDIADCVHELRSIMAALDNIVSAA